MHEKIIEDSRELLQFYYLIITQIYSVWNVDGVATSVSSYNVGS